MTIAFDLALDAIEEVALKLLHLAASQAGHMHVIALRTPLVKMPFPFNVEQVEFVHQTVPF